MTFMAERVTVIMTVLNESRGMADLLEGFLGQSRQPDEIVVVDGGSSDNTVEILREYAARDPRIKVFIEHGVNIARGRNIAIDKVTSPVVAVTDGGCRPDPHWLEELIKPFLEDPEVGAVSGRRVIESRNTFEFFSGLLSTSRDPGSEKDRLFFGRSSAFRKEIWQKAGGYPEWLYTAEDTLFAKRAKELGCKVAYAPDSIVHWRPRPTWRKLAKQFYLYGRGNGRIGNGDVKASLYHLRNHALWVFFLLAGFAFPPLWLLSLGVVGFIYVNTVLPTLKPLRAEVSDMRREIYVPAIIFLRSLFHNLGFLRGAWEYRNNHLFREMLKAYQGDG
jgi:cellulose synthase/poly-beta-1,6-N-acetylglucosamine synthase-like glycosyltransferase